MMKKISMYMLLAIAGWSLTACDESFNDWKQPEVYTQEAIITIDGFSATPTDAAAGNINLGTMESDDATVQLFNFTEGKLPDGVTLENIRLEAKPADQPKATAHKVEATKEGLVTKAELAKLVYAFYGKKATERTFDANLFANAKKGSEAQLITLGSFKLYVTPEELENPYYYLYGIATNSKAEFAYKSLMTPDPESDVIYTYTCHFPSNNDLVVWNSKYWADGWQKPDLTKVYCADQSGKANQGESGKAIQGALNWFIAPVRANYYTFTIDLEALTYTWTKLEDQNPAVYNQISLIGVGGDWGTDIDMEATDNTNATLRKTYKVTQHNWYTQLNLTEETTLKFRANHAWDTDWGFGANEGDWTVSDDNWAKTCTNGAANIKVPAGKYNVYFCDITGAAEFVPAE